MIPFSIFVGCAPGLKPLLLEEITEHGGQETKSVDGGFSLEADRRLLAALCVNLGVGSTLRARVGEQFVRDFPALVRKTAALPFEDFGAGALSSIRVSTRKSRLFHTKAIEERVRAGLAKRSAGGEGATVHVRLQYDQLTWSVDAAGAPLHERGYRLATAKAPLREDLARALVRLSGWSRDEPLVDPFCGSGTVVAEAARWAVGRAPGLDRTFACESWFGLDEAFVAARAAAEERARRSAPPIYGSDRDEGAIEAARANLDRAKVFDKVELSKAALLNAPGLQPGLSETGIVVSNPPHGGRIGDSKDLVKLYQSVGRRFFQMGGKWRLALLAADRRLAYQTAVPVKSAVMTSQGGRKVWVMVSSEDLAD